MVGRSLIKMARLLNPQEFDESDEEQDEEPPKKDVLSLSDLKNLIYVGRLKKVVEISGFEFVVTTLSTRQQKDLVQRVMRTGQDDRILELKPITLSYAIESINGAPLESLCDDPSIKDPSERRMYVIFELQATLLERLFQVYEELISASNKEVGLEEVKK